VIICFYESVADKMLLPPPETTTSAGACLSLNYEQNSINKSCFSMEAFYIFLYFSNDWAELSNSPTHRNKHGCGRVTSQTGTREIVVAGGVSTVEYLDSVDIFNLESMSWRSGEFFSQKKCF
jgi:hypothetical protein